MGRQIVVIAHNVRSLHNVGSIFRTADGAGVKKVFLTGYTGTPPRIQISKVALGSELVVPWERSRPIAPVLRQLRELGFSIVALEQDSRSIDYASTNLPNKIALIVGNEIRGVSKPLRDQCDYIIEIPMIGSRHSLNVSVAFGIAAFQLARG